MRDLAIEAMLQRSPFAPSLRSGAHCERRNTASKNLHLKCHPCPRPCVTYVPGQNTASVPYHEVRAGSRALMDRHGD